MFKKLFKKKSKKEPTISEEELKIIDDAMARAINERKKEDPLIGPKIGAKELVGLAMKMLKNEKGVHIETLLVLLASAAGYACQESIRYEYITKGKKSEKEVFVIMGCEDGSKYYYGDLINKPIIDGKYSIWSLAAGMVQELGVKELIDINEIFSYVASTLCQENFGDPRFPQGHNSGLKPSYIVKNIYPDFVPLLNRYCDDPTYWPILFGLAIQNVIQMAKDVIDPNLALKIVMECSVSMSKININDIK